MLRYDNLALNPSHQHKLSQELTLNLS